MLTMVLVRGTHEELRSKKKERVTEQRWERGALKMEKGAANQELQGASRSFKRQEMEAPLSASGRS